MSESETDRKIRLEKDSNYHKRKFAGESEEAKKARLENIEALLSLNVQQNVQGQIVIINISHHLCYCYFYFYNSLRSTWLAKSNF